MSKQIIINSGIREKRAAILLNNKVEDIFFERDSYDPIAGNIYRGIVKNILPGMQSAFIDIGIVKNAFLYIDELYPILQEKEKEKLKNNELGIKKVLKQGQNLLLQVVKEPIGNKGAKVTTKLSIPGRQLVLLPLEKRIGISKRIQDFDERKRLKDIARKLTDGEYGLIVRTNANQKKNDDIKRDYDYLTGLWQEIQRDFNFKKGPSLIYRDADLLTQIVRDYFSYDVDKLIIDSKKD
jgi:ribonuclease G